MEQDTFMSRAVVLSHIEENQNKENGYGNYTKS